MEENPVFQSRGGRSYLRISINASLGVFLYTYEGQRCTLVYLTKADRQRLIWELGMPEREAEAEDAERYVERCNRCGLQRHHPGEDDLQ
jgi:hypothetical protein